MVVNENCNPYISVIIAVYNGERYLQRAIDSVIIQTYKNIESIIVDGGSTDLTLEILQKNTSNMIKYISEPDKGIADAWNKGIRIARGRWIIFLGADDQLADCDVLMKLLPSLKEYENKADVLFADVMLVDDKGTCLKRVGEKWSWKEFRKRMSIPHQGAFHSKTYFKDNGLYDISFKIVADYELLLRKKEKLRAVYIKRLVSKMQMGGISQTNVKSVLREWKNAQLLHSVSNINYIYLIYSWFVLKFWIKNLLRIVLKYET